MSHVKNALQYPQRALNLVRQRSRRRIAIVVLVAGCLLAASGCTLFANQQYELDTNGLSWSNLSAPALLTMYSEPTSQMAYLYEYPCHASTQCTMNILANDVNIPGALTMPIIGGSMSYEQLWQFALLSDNYGNNTLGVVLYAAIYDSGNVLVGGDVPCFRATYHFAAQAWNMIDQRYWGVSSTSLGLVGFSSSTCYIGQAFGS